MGRTPQVAQLSVSVPFHVLILCFFLPIVYVSLCLCLDVTCSFRKPLASTLSHQYLHETHFYFTSIITSRTTEYYFSLHHFRLHETKVQVQDVFTVLLQLVATNDHALAHTHRGTTVVRQNARNIKSRNRAKRCSPRELLSHQPFGIRRHAVQRN